MLIFDDGTTVGSVSGGCLESSIIDRAGDVIDSDESQLLRYDGSRDDVILGEGAMCDGEVAITLENIDPALSGALERLASDHAPDVMVAVLDDPTRGPTTRIVPAGSPGGDLQTVMFLERVQHPLKLILCGAGALADSVATLATTLGWEPLIVDHRRHFLSGMRAPVKRIDSGDELGALISIPARTGVVVMTHHFERDLALVESALRADPLYVGLLGSRGRSARLADEVRQRDPGLDLSRLHAPVGLDIGSETIEEIALSITAEIQAVRRGSDGRSLRRVARAVHGRPTARVAAIVLAAGGSRRMGAPKLLLPGPTGGPLLGEALDAIRDLELSDIVLIDGAEPRVAAVAHEHGFRTIHNKDWEEGVGSSLRAGVNALGEDVDAVLVVLADQPRIRRRDIESLLETWRAGQAPVVATAYPEGGGVPAIFDRSLFDELRRLEGDRGARDLIRSVEGVEFLTISDTRDVDSPESYERVMRGSASES